MALDSRFEDSSPFSDIDIQTIEEILRRKLPADYCDFVKVYGGSFVGGAINIPAREDLTILTFFGPGNDNRSVLAKLSRHPDLREDGILPFADCELGNLYVLDRDGVIHYINYYGGVTQVIEVCRSFSEFVARISVEEED